MTVNDEQAPIIRVSGTVTEKDYIRHMRESGSRLFPKYALVFIVGIPVITLAMSFFRFYHDIKTGYITIAEWLSSVAKALIDGSVIVPALIFLALYGVLLLVYRPYKAGKRFRELYPNDVKMTYDFRDDQLDVITDSQTTSQTLHLRYADVQRKIRDLRSGFVLRTNQRNGLVVYKSIMSPQEIESVRALLNERCPQKKVSA